MRENEAYPQLYQDSAARKTRDQAITILQGRCVGGSTTVNWTSSFRTPDETLNWWGERWALPGYEPEALSPWFAQAERRLGIGPWLVPPNENNDLLRRGGMKLGIPVPAIQRNVRGCLNLGYCGMGCPANAKQSMLVTTIPAALELGATSSTGGGGAWNPARVASASRASTMSRASSADRRPAQISGQTSRQRSALHRAFNIWRGNFW